MSWLFRHKPYVMRFAAVERHRESKRVCVSVSVWAIAFCLPLGHMCHLLGTKHTKTHFYMHVSSAFLRELYIHFVLHFFFRFWVLIFGLWNQITTIAPLYLRWFFFWCSVRFFRICLPSIPFHLTCFIPIYSHSSRTSTQNGLLFVYLPIFPIRNS